MENINSTYEKHKTKNNIMPHIFYKYFYRKEKQVIGDSFVKVLFPKINRKFI
jgi:hypothetical protein